jgi:hypothetical protein
LILDWLAQNSKGALGIYKELSFNMKAAGGNLPPASLQILLRKNQLLT